MGRRGGEEREEDRGEGRGGGGRKRRRGARARLQLMLIPAHSHTSFPVCPPSGASVSQALLLTLVLPQGNPELPPRLADPPCSHGAAVLAPGPACPTHLPPGCLVPTLTAPAQTTLREEGTEETVTRGTDQASCLLPERLFPAQAGGGLTPRAPAGSGGGGRGRGWQAWPAS